MFKVNDIVHTGKIESPYSKDKVSVISEKMGVIEKDDGHGWASVRFGSEVSPCFETRDFWVQNSDLRLASSEEISAWQAPVS